MTIPTASQVWRKYQLDGVPASGPNNPDKDQIIGKRRSEAHLIGA
ncbi:hypothetical protein [Bradyrhizobium sp. 156]|nr:hypothetical protein [Bradyrhizobium sp. 156]